jgi:putative endonuclease
MKKSLPSLKKIFFVYLQTHCFHEILYFVNSYWTYIVRCSDGSYYTGVTDDICYRIDQHNAGKNRTAYTFKRRPVVLVYSTEFSDVYEAIHWEKVLKRWSRAKKEALIFNTCELLPILAKKNFSRKYLQRCASLRSRMTRSTRHDIYVIFSISSGMYICHPE